VVPVAASVAALPRLGFAAVRSPLPAAMAVVCTPSTLESGGASAGSGGGSRGGGGGSSTTASPPSWTSRVGGRAGVSAAQRRSNPNAAAALTAHAAVGTGGCPPHTAAAAEAAMSRCWVDRQFQLRALRTHGGTARRAYSASSAADGSLLHSPAVKERASEPALPALTYRSRYSNQRVMKHNQNNNTSTQAQPLHVHTCHQPQHKIEAARVNLVNMACCGRCR